MKRIPPNNSSDGPTRSRYPGTRPFSDSPEDYERFFGRNDEGEQLYLRVLSVSLLLQFATSGLGKTSLLQASLFPRLRQKPFLPVMIRLNKAEETLADAVARSFEQACRAEKLELPELRKDGLWELLSTALVWRDDLLLTPVLVFDQFEEVFTLRDPAFRLELAEELGALAIGVTPDRLRSKVSGDPERFGARPDVKIVISLREDYLGALEEFSPAIPNLFHERLRLEPFTEKAAREAITNPARLVAKEGEEPFWTPQFDFEPSALDSMITYLEGKSGVIEPFTLQLLCRHAEAIAHGKSDTRDDSISLTLADFSGAKSFESVLKDFYQTALDKLPKSARGKAEELCEHGLLDRDGRRLLLEEQQIHSEFGIDVETLEILARERLIRRERRLESVFYEIGHDRLAESIFASRRNRLPKTEQQRIFKFKMLFAGASALCLILFGLGVVSWISYSQAVSSRQEAEKQKRVAELANADAVVEKIEAEKQQEAEKLEEQEAEAESSRAQKAEKMADRERQKAEELLGFALGEKFLGEIREIGRTSTLEKVRKMSEVQADDTEKQPTLVRGLALRNAGDIERNKGHLNASLDYFLKALKVIEDTPYAPDKAREIARTHDRLGDAMQDSRQIPDALSHYKAEVAAWRQVLQASPPETTDAADDCTSLAEAMANSGYLENQKGESAGALKDFDEALEIVSSLLFGAQSSHPECRLPASKIEPYPNAKALMILSEIATSRSDIFWDDGKAAGPLAARARELMPPSVSASRNAVVALAYEAGAETGLAALKDYRKAMAESEDLQRGDPDNKLLQRDRAEVQLLMGRTIASCHCAATNDCACPADKAKNCEPAPSLEEAEVMALEAMATLRTLAQSDPTNLSWKSDCGWALQTYAKVLAAQGRNSERLKALKQSEAIYTELERDDDAQSVVKVALLFEDKAEALADPSQPDRSKAAMQSALGRWKKLITAHQGIASYSDYLRESLGRQASILRILRDKIGADAASKEQNDTVSTNEELKKEGSRLIAEYKMHTADGRKMLDEKRYDAALEEFKAAETEELEYIRYSAITDVKYDNLSYTYSLIAETQKELGNTNEQAAALSSSMHAAEVAAAIDPAQELDHLFVARLDLLRFNFDNDRTDDAMLSTARQMLADADSLAHGDVQSAPNLWALANANFALGAILRSKKSIGWPEAIRTGLMNEEAAALIDKKVAKYPKEAGDWRKTLAGYLDEENPDDAEEARSERQLALKDYQDAERRDPANEEIKKAIRELAGLGVK